jgi:hypothetical protein
MPTESSEKPTIVLPIKDSKIRFQNDNCLAHLFLVDFQYRGARTGQPSPPQGFLNHIDFLLHEIRLYWFPNGVY